MTPKWPAYLGTILLEPNRWPDRAATTYSGLSRLSGINQGPPRILVSEWLERARADGFDGVELWENHALLSSDEELTKLANGPLPVAVFSSYFGLEDAGAGRREMALELVQKLGARGVKYNFGHDKARIAEYVRNLKAWAAKLDPSVRLLDECHSGGIYAGPEDVAAMLKELGDARFQGTVHFVDRYENRPLVDWVRAMGGRLGHIHVQRVVEHGKAAVRERVRLLKDHGFAGSFTIEFTSGIDWGQPQPDTETLYQSAVADMNMLKEALAA